MILVASAKMDLRGVSNVENYRNKRTHSINR